MVAASREDATARTAGELLARAESVYRLSTAEPAAAAEPSAALVREARAAADVQALVVALLAQAYSSRLLLDQHGAKALLDDAVRTARRAGLASRVAQGLLARAAVNQELGNAAAAARDLEAARPLLGPTRTAEVDFQRGTLMHNAGRLKEAAGAYHRALAAGTLPVADKVRVANNLGMIEAQLGRHEQSLGHVAEALELAREVGPAVYAVAAEGQAWATVQAGRVTEGLRLFTQAEQLW
ncbi:tetratricopeptide repeat protein, partial [Motilibacter deserti]